VSDKWHYAEGQKSVGPLNMNEMQEVFSKVSDPRNLLVWKVGFKDWMHAEDVPELAELIDKPPPLPELRRDPPQIAPASEPKTSVGKARVRDWKWTLLQTALFAIIVTLVAVSDVFWEWAPTKAASGLIGVVAGWILTGALPRKLGRKPTTLGIVLPIIAVGVGVFGYKYATLGWDDDVAGLTGRVRSSFVQASIDACVKQQSDDKSFSTETISQYCRCYSNDMADRVSKNELKSLKNMKQEEKLAVMQPKIDVASDACARKILQ
jgi:GYF domain 2